MMAIVHDLAEAQGAIIQSFPFVLFPAKAVSLLAVGDIAPREGIPKAEKRRLEAVRSLPSFPPHPDTFTTTPYTDIDKASGPAQEAMQNFVHELLHDSSAALKIMSLWKEYEDQSTAEARFVKGGRPSHSLGYCVE